VAAYEGPGPPPIMLTSIECAGHPRDMGLAQGIASRAAITREAIRLGLPCSRSRIPSLRALAVGSVRGAGAGREMFRHFAHLSERLEGLSRNADLPVDSLLEMHLRIRAGGEQAGLLARRASVAAHLEESARDSKSWSLDRTLPVVLNGEAGWILRESRPEVGFRSVEVTLPWLVSAVAGVNEAGLAVVSGPLLWGAPGYEGYPTSLLLVQECLQRFPDLDGALDWCGKRPVEGDQSFVLADASGGLATVVFTGRECRVSVGEGELHLESGELPGDGDSAAGADAIEEPLDSKGARRDRDEDRVSLDPLSRSLTLRIGGVSLGAQLDPMLDEGAAASG